MARTFIRQDTQIRKSDTYTDSTAPTEANFETNPVNIEDDLNNLRSQVHNLLKDQAGNWYDDLNTPSTFENGTQRGVNDLNQDLHDLERKRLLRRRAVVAADIGPITTNAQHVVLGAGELPGNTTAAVGAVTTLGTVVAYEASFDTATLTEVAGASNIQPKNLCLIVDTASGDPILDSGGHQVYGLLQSESNTDGHTIGATTPNRVQISFVVRNATNDDLVLVTAGDMDAKNIDYAPIERYSLEDIPEQAWLGDDFVDAGAAATDRQGVYDNQGTSPVDQTTNAILDLESAGIYWEIRDDAEATLFRVTEGSAGGTSEVTIDSAVDLYDNNAVDVDFNSGISANSGGTRPIDVGVNDGLVETTAGNLEVKAAGEVILNDTNMVSEATWTGPGVKVSETTTEVTDYETAFGGEVSLMNAIVQAYNHGARGTKVYANVTSTTVADTDVGGVGGGANLDAQLPDMSGGTFLTDYDLFLNGALLRPGADAAANNDYYPGTSLANGQVKFEFTVKLNDVICVIPYA